MVGGIFYLKIMSKIKCVAGGIKNDSYIIERMGKIEHVSAGTKSAWWWDEHLNLHSQVVNTDDELPEMELIPLRGSRVTFADERSISTELV